MLKSIYDKIVIENLEKRNDKNQINFTRMSSKGKLMQEEALTLLTLS